MKKIKDKIEILHYVRYRIKVGNEVVESGIKLKMLECDSADILGYKEIQTEEFEEANYIIYLDPKLRERYTSVEPLKVYVKDLPITIEYYDSE